MPCFPGNLGYIFIPECGTNIVTSMLSTNMGTIVKIVMAIITTTVIEFTSTALVFELVIFAMPQIFCLSNYLKMLCQRIETRYCRIENMNKIYREIQILTIEYNNIHQNTLTIQLTLFICSCFILPLYMLIAFWNEIPLIYGMFCIGCVFDTSFVIWDLDGNIKSDVYRASQNIQRITKRKKCSQNDKIFWRVVKSWRILRVNIGPVNFYEKFTAMQILNFNMTVVINLLLL